MNFIYQNELRDSQIPVYQKAFRADKQNGLPVLFFLSLLFVSLGAVLCLLRLVGAECNIHAPTDFLKLGNLGAGIFQRVIFRFPLPAVLSPVPVALSIVCASSPYSGGYTRLSSPCVVPVPLMLPFLPLLVQFLCAGFLPCR